MIGAILREKNVFHELDNFLEVILLENQNLERVVDYSGLVGEHLIDADLKNAVGGDE
jgi:hypothetical protein